MHSERIAVTLGDPAGIGPEVTAKALFAKRDLRNSVVVVGNGNSFRRALENARIDRDFIHEIDFHDVPGDDVEFGLPQKEAGQISLESIRIAVDLVNNGDAVAMCTAPINKEAIIAAGSQDIDHTTMLARLTRSEKVSTVFEVGGLRILFANKHVPLIDAITSVTFENVRDSIDLADEALALLGTKRKRIAVAALNPHAGEAGLIGREEIEEIIPAINSKKDSVDVSGPYPADSVFYRASKGEFDMVISLYHDQGHIAAKMLDFNGTVSMNLGLPFLRTSVDHGTAFDIAGKNQANPESMIRAIETAVRYASQYKKNITKLRK